MKKLLGTTRSSRISYKVSFFVSGLVIFAFTLLEAYNFVIIKSEVTKEIHNEQYTQAKFIAQDINNKLKERTNFLGALADLISLDKFTSEEDLTLALKRHLTFTTFFPQGLTIINPDGTGMFAEYPVIPGRRDLITTHAEWFIRTVNSHSVIISVPFKSQVVNNEVLIVIAKAIRDTNDNIVGILQAPIFLNRPEFLGYIFNKTHRPESEIDLISKANKLIITSSNKSKILKLIPEKGINSFYHSVIVGFNGYKKTTDVSGNESLIAAFDVNVQNWSVIIKTPVAKAYQNLNERLKTSIINGLVISFITILTITFFLFRFFYPLRIAAESVKKMVSEKQPLSHLNTYKNDEIGDLIVGFNALIDLVNERSDKLEKAYEELKSLSKTDGLTGIFNRRHFDDSFNHVWKVLMRSQEPVTILMIDIDHFKKYNDTYGHTTGDDCLKRVAEAIQKSINRPTDCLARYGGEEFVILLQGAAKEGMAVAEKARLAVNDLNIEHKSSSYQYVTISLGIASIVPQFNVSPIELVKQADVALYQSKELGRNRSEFYRTNMWD